jgi:hypothetical protein
VKALVAILLVQMALAALGLFVALVQGVLWPMITRQDLLMPGQTPGAVFAIFVVVSALPVLALLIVLVGLDILKEVQQ